MAFITKTDYCGLGSTTLVCSSDAEGASGSDVTASDDKGTIVASTYVYGGASPSNDYDLKGTTSLAIKLGKVTAVGGKAYMLKGVQITTTNSGAPTVSASCDEVETGATTACTYDAPSISLKTEHHAAMLFSEGTMTGSGCNITGTSYDISADTSIERDELGEAVSSDVHAGKIVSTITISQSGSTAPSFTAAEGWQVTSPLTRTNPKSDYPSWTVSVTKYLTKTTVAAG